MGRAEWSDLPKELLQLIAEHLKTQTDVSRFRAVCKWWRFSVLPFQIKFVMPQMVPRLFPFLFSSSSTLTQNTFYHLSPPPATGQHLTASSTWDWLVKLKQGKKLGHFHVIYPLPGKDSYYSFPKELNTLQLRLSELTKSYTLQFRNSDYKVVLSQNPPSLMVEVSGNLWHLKLGHDKWTLIDYDINGQDMYSMFRDNNSYDDIIIYKDNFCAVNSLGRTIVVDPSTLNITEIASSTPEFKLSRGHRKKKLVESNGELLMVHRYLKEFKVYKLKVEQKQNRWVEIKSLDDQILYLAKDCSFSVSARDFRTCKGNCILYNNGVSLSLFNLDDGRLSLVGQHPEYARIFYPAINYDLA